MPTIHVKDLARLLDVIFLAAIGHSDILFEPYMIAVDRSSEAGATQKSIMEAISKGIGSGATQQLSISDALKESWCEFLQVDVKLKASKSLQHALSWKCYNGICDRSMAMLNDEFNFYRGLFPLKVLIAGPPASGKTHFAKKLAEQYGVPHITIQDVVEMGMQLKGEQGEKL